MRLVEIVGWLNVLLIIIMTSIFPIKKIYLNKKDKRSKQKYQFLRRIHPYIGILLLILSAFHGNMALGFLIFHTGTLLYGLIILMALISMLKYKPFNFSKWRLFHKIVALCVWGALFLHIFYRNIFF